MANALWLSPYWSDLATISASTTSGSLAASNMQGYEPTQVWRSTAGSGSYIDLDFGASGAIAPTAVALIGTNLGASDTMSIFGSNTSNAAARAGAATSTGNAYVAKSTESGWPYHIAFRKFTNASSLRYWSITFPSVAGSSIDVGRLMFGAHLTPTINLDQDFVIEHVSADMRERTDYNKAMLARRGNVARRFALQYSHADVAETQRGFARLSRLRGNGGDFFFSLDPDDATYFPEYSGQFTLEQLSMPSRPYFNGSGQMWAMRASLLEVV
jgi:hypothetical protein